MEAKRLSRISEAEKEYSGGYRKECQAKSLFEFTGFVPFPHTKLMTLFFLFENTETVIFTQKWLKSGILSLLPNRP